MKIKGKLTFIGKVGIILGLFTIILGFFSMMRTGFRFEIKDLFPPPMPLIGVALIIVSFLWARKPVDKKKEEIDKL